MTDSLSIQKEGIFTLSTGAIFVCFDTIPWQSVAPSPAINVIAFLALFADFPATFTFKVKNVALFVLELILETMVVVVEGKVADVVAGCEDEE